MNTPDCNVEPLSMYFLEGLHSFNAQTDKLNIYGYNTNDTNSSTYHAVTKLYAIVVFLENYFDNIVLAVLFFKLTKIEK